MNRFAKRAAVSCTPAIVHRQLATLCMLTCLLTIHARATAGSPAAGWCLKPDMNYDRQVDLADVDPFVDALLTDPADPATRCAADMSMDGALNGSDIMRFIEVLLSPDADADGVPDIYETDNGILLNAASTGSSPSNGDTDDDGISDGDELYDTLAGLDLHAMGASPVRKDLFIEVDWFDEPEGGFHSHRPTAPVITIITSAFANSPVPNPYAGATGISLHIDYGQGGAFTSGNLIPGGDTVILFDSEFNIYKAANFNPNRFGYFHYSIFAHAYGTLTNPSSGFAEIGGDDFVVTLQNYTFEPWIAQTMMHELGHNLGLRHGGFENRNFKPNYNSVMNYRYQFDGIDINCDPWGDLVCDYSVGERIVLNEASLDENAGTCGATPIDWDWSGTITTGLARNITCYSGCHTACNVSDPCCEGAGCNVLQDHDDWANLTLSGLTQGDLRLPEIVTCQDTPRHPPGGGRHQLRPSK